MKKCKLFALACLIWVAMPAKADLAPTVMLHRGGQVKTYMYYEVQKAVDDAVDGDTIFLTAGTFQPFNINKRILVRGAGPNTIIEGNCIIDIPGTDKLKMPVLDALSFNGDVQVDNAYEQFTLRKCSMNSLIFNEDEGKEFYDVKIDRCYIDTRLNLPNNVIAFNGFNSRIYSLYPHNYTGHAVFNHCNIGQIIAPITGGEFYSCAVGPCKKLPDAESTKNLIGCLLNSCFYANSYVQSQAGYNIAGVNYQLVNCVGSTASDGNENSTYLNFNNSGSSYISADDGTKIGAYGGQHPYNRDPEVPGVTKHEISIDAATRTMTVKLTVDKLDK